jgi:hypothetical protein
MTLAKTPRTQRKALKYEKQKHFFATPDPAWSVRSQKRFTRQALLICFAWLFECSHSVEVIEDSLQ